MGPKKGGANRGASSGKKSSKPQEISINDFVAAGANDGGKGKGKGKGKDKAAPDTGASAESAKGKGKGKQKDAPDAGEAADQPKKPSVRSVIGGASWTGKLPVNLLSEHCQREKWEKPEYTTVLPLSL